MNQSAKMKRFDNIKENKIKIQINKLKRNL